MPAGALPLSHLLLALAVVAVWGTNFVIIRQGLDDLPPLLFATLRCAFVVFPAILYLPRPAVPWRHLAAYGLLIGAGQFGLLFIAMNGFISPGLASLVVQVQVFFTIGLAMAAAGEKIGLFQVLALILAASGVLVILAHTDGSATTPVGLALVLLAALAWAGGNHVAKLGGRLNMLAYVTWASLFSVPPLLALSLLMEGAPAILEGLRQADLATWAAVAWQSAGNSLFGYAAWGWLLARHPAATITPMAMLVPVFGMGASALLLGEPMPPWKIIAAALVLAGLAVNLLWPIVVARRLPPPAA
ncbi:MAG: EamA family transporter [Caulobacteraceae bacterium]|nr:EamA family transporter [Caulobacteraceae bacterium]